MEYGIGQESIWIEVLYIVQMGKELLEGATYVCNYWDIGGGLCDFVFEMEGEIEC